jgi:hypothetical protein
MYFSSPSVRYECLIYANKQNIERQKASVRQETVFITNMVLNNSTTTNVLMCKLFTLVGGRLTKPLFSSTKGSMLINV